MKLTGISRKIDELGRIVIPMEIRNNLNIKEKDDFDIYLEEDKIILKKISNYCICCHSHDDLKNFSNTLLCQSCINSIKKL